MDFNALPYGNGVHLALAPVDLSLAATATLRAGVRDVELIALYFFLKAGGSSENVTVTLTQNTLNASGSSKALPIKRAYYKVATTAFTNANAGTTDRWTQIITPDAPASSWDTTAARVASTNAFQGLLLIDAAQLDLAGGYPWIEAQFTDPGSTAQLGLALWCPQERAYRGKNSTKSILAA